MDKEKIIKELNIIFKENGWELLLENNKYSNKTGNKIIFEGYPNHYHLYIDRTNIPYEKYINKFTIKQLDEYVVEFIKNICLKYELSSIIFGNYNFFVNNNNCNEINLKLKSKHL